MVRVLDLYCGMGGLSLGFTLGIRNAEVLGLDIDRYAVDTYNYNLGRYGCKAKLVDVLEWEPRGSYEIVMGGIPCNPYSLANTRRRGRDHPLYPTLPRFFDIVLELQPKVFLMENVKGLVTKRHRPLLFEQLDRVRYDYVIAWRVLNSAHYGVPQRRERVFVLGIRRDLGVEPSFPRRTHAEEERTTLDGKLYRWVTVREAIGDLLLVPPENMLNEKQVGRILVERLDTSRHRAPMEFPDPIDKPSRTISSHTVEGTKRETIVLPVTDHVVINSKIYGYEWSRRVVPSDKPSYTITEHHRSGQLVEVSSIVVQGRYRRLTVRECLRLQSFPDWWGFPRNISISRKYRLVGEAVPPIVSYRLATHIGRLMGWDTGEPPRQEDWALPFFHRAFQDYLLSKGF